MTVAEWRQLYRELLTCAPMEAAEQLLESAVEEATEQAAPETSLARIGRILSVDVKQINALAPTGRMTMLVLQTVCRLLRACKKQTKALKKELYVLLDRLALLLDAANPPSLGEEDDRSPFQQFLQHVIGLRLQRFLPVLLKEVNVRYELEDAEEEDASPLKAISAKVATPIAEPSPSPAPTGAATKSSILSALQDEKRPVKRRRTEVSDSKLLV
ncbi:TPA: hypothetical protein N0F65_005305 [Lagenidium giganteum]|uniref:Uncharacterized protein n=1 Tax=Lagenidium giganteum TaxID=4803 RepID=A0AAV2Z1E0_9STRA|nr:TPA: hypothetical protein N0F65_005305 [Lagenidium giganteum]